MLNRSTLYSFIILFVLVFLPPQAIWAKGDTLNEKKCSLNGKKLLGKIQVVKSFPDLKVQVVKSFPDLKVKWVSNFPDECGKWQKVTSFPDLKIQFVQSFPDLKIKIVDSFPGIP